VPSSAVLGWGAVLPPRVVTTAELAPSLGRSAAAIEAACGIARRHWVEPGVAPSDLGRDASRQALAAAGLEPVDVDLIVFATMTPDVAFPGSGCFLQDKLGCRTIGALDVRAQCAGFLFALATADRFVRAGTAAHVLVVGGEVHSTALDRSAAGACATPIFGDGAGALVLGPADAPDVRAVVLHSDPAGWQRFWCEFPASRNHPARMTRAAFEAGRHFYRIEPEALHADAETRLVAVAREALARADVPPDRLALAVMHYLDPRVARRAGLALGLGEDRVVATAGAIGHVAAGGIPIAIADALATGRLRRGDLVCCAAWGAGISWGAAVLRV